MHVCSLESMFQIFDWGAVNDQKPRDSRLDLQQATVLRCSNATCARGSVLAPSSVVAILVMVSGQLG